MAVVSKIAKGAAKAATKGAKKKAVKSAPKKVPAPKPKKSAPKQGPAKKPAPSRKAPEAKAKPATNAVGMRFDMAAGASAGSAAPSRGSFIPGKAGSSAPARGKPMAPAAAKARVGGGTASGMVPVTPYKPPMSAKTQRKVGAAAGAVGITGGMIATAEQKEKSLVRAARQGSRSRK